MQSSHSCNSQPCQFGYLVLCLAFRHSWLQPKILELFYLLLCRSIRLLANALFRVSCRDVEAETGSRSGGSGKFLWKGKLETVKKYRFCFHFGHSYRTSKLEYGATFKKIYDEKWMFNCSSFGKKHFSKLVIHLDSGQPPPYQLKDEPCS